MAPPAAVPFSAIRIAAAEVKRAKRARRNARLKRIPIEKYGAVAIRLVRAKSALVQAEKLWREGRKR